MATDSTSEVILSDEELFRVSTDLEDYAPGSTAIITAEGVDVGGSVTFEVEHVTDAGEDGVYGTADDTTVDFGGDGHDSWTVVDGGEGDLDGEANGVIVTSWYVNPDDSLDETFLLSADDGTDVTYDSFTDSHTPQLVTVVDNDPDADYLPLYNWNDHGTIGDAWFVQGHVHDTDSTGTGNILPFVRIHSTESEEGYNSSYRPTEFDEDTNDNWNHDLLLEQIPIVTGIDVDLDGIIDVIPKPIVENGRSLSEGRPSKAKSKNQGRNIKSYGISPLLGAADYETKTHLRANVKPLPQDFGGRREGRPCCSSADKCG